MKPAKPLNILITRPGPPGEMLFKEVNAAGFKAILFPTIAFLPPADPNAMQQDIAALDKYDWLIFISPQAVYASSAAILQRWPALPLRLKIAAVGAGTAQALQAENFPEAIYPAEQWNSEGLLELPDFQNVSGKKIALVCGEDGRDLLADTLTTRGAEVTQIITYRRTLPKTPVNKIGAMLRKNNIACMVCTSNDGLQNLTKLFSASQPKLRSIPLVVISQRMQDLATQLEFEKIFLARNASHDAIIEVLRDSLTLTSQQGLTMENQTEHTTDTETVVKTPSGKSSAWGSLGILISACSFIVLIAAFYFSYNALMANDNKLNALTDAMNNKITANQQALDTLRQSITEADTNSKAVQTALADQQRAISQLHTTDQSKTTLGIDEAQYLTALAQDNLQIGDNVPLVITLLQSADQKLRDLTDGRLVSIRKALAADIAALQAVPAVDITGIYLQLMALNTQADKLAMPTLRPEQTTAVAVDEGNKAVWWKRGLQNSWDVIRKMVVIRYNKSGQIPFITPDQQQYLYQNLHAMFEQAMSAVVHKQPEIYQASLTQAANWINQYFLADAPTTQALLAGINKLQAQNIKPTLPDINATLQALRDFTTAPQSTTGQQ